MQFFPITYFLDAGTSAILDSLTADRVLGAGGKLRCKFTSIHKFKISYSNLGYSPTPFQRLCIIIPLLCCTCLSNVNSQYWYETGFQAELATSVLQLLNSFPNSINFQDSNTCLPPSQVLLSHCICSSDRDQNWWGKNTLRAPFSNTVCKSQEAKSSPCKLHSQELCELGLRVTDQNSQWHMHRTLSSVATCRGDKIPIQGPQGDLRSHLLMRILHDFVLSKCTRLHGVKHSV